MKAWMVHEWCSPRGMVLQDAPVPEPGEGEALVRVHAAALNFFDVLMIGGRYQIKPPLPFVAGCEIAGEVVEAGPGSDYQPGERVCSQPDWGGFAEYVVVPNATTNRVPADVPWQDATCIPVVYATSHLALKHRAGIEPGETVLVTAGAGGVGLAAIQLARAWGRQ